MFIKMLLASGALTAILIASPALAKSPIKYATATSTATSTAIACVGKVVATREAAFDVGATAYQAAVNSAYSTRAKSLASAYATGTSAGVASGVKIAWATFNASIKDANAAWSTKRLAVWASFKSSAALCKAPAGILDSAK